MKVSKRPQVNAEICHTFFYLILYILDPFIARQSKVHTQKPIFCVYRCSNTIEERTFFHDKDPKSMNTNRWWRKITFKKVYFGNRAQQTVDFHLFDLQKK